VVVVNGIMVENGSMEAKATDPCLDAKAAKTIMTNTLRNVWLVHLKILHGRLVMLSITQNCTESQQSLPPPKLPKTNHQRLQLLQYQLVEILLKPFQRSTTQALHLLLTLLL